MLHDVATISVSLEVRLSLDAPPNQQMIMVQAPNSSEDARELSFKGNEGSCEGLDRSILGLLICLLEPRAMANAAQMPCVWDDVVSVQEVHRHFQAKMAPSSTSTEALSDSASSGSLPEIAPPPGLEPWLDPSPLVEGLRQTMLHMHLPAPEKVERRRAPRRQRVQRRSKHNFTVYFEGFDPEVHRDFELVPRLIGRQGCNMKPIYNTGAMAEVRGGTDLPKARDGHDMLQLAVSCSTPEVQEAALRAVSEVLQNLAHHFKRFCSKKQLPCPELFRIQ